MSLKGLIARLPTLGQEIRSATKTVTEGIAELRRAIDAKKAEIERTRNARATTTEMIANAERLLGDVGTRYVKEHGDEVLRMLSGQWKNPAHAAAPGLGHVTAPRLPFDDANPPGLSAWCAAHMDTAKDFHRQLVMNIVKILQPDMIATSEKPAHLERLAGELADLEAKEEQLVDEASAAGVKIEHRPEVVQRRETERRQREREAAAAAERKATEDAINAAHAQRVAGVPSPYLEAARAERAALRGR